MKPADALAALHAETDARFAESTAAIEAPIGCKPGCAACCVDGLTVWQAEADAIAAFVRRSDAPPLQVHPEGACAFLGADRQCQVFAARPYVCRSQGAVLRWWESGPGDVDDDDDDWGDLAAALSPDAAQAPPIERRSTCAEHLRDVDIEALPDAAIFELGPAEDRLVAIAVDGLRLAGGRGLPGRVGLRDLALTL
ncbi:MAG: YkgJ family cysteine cluster protein [Deltaproteobacteria bacterium]|nr:YkgJ family cysteine cluster protein [Deltaproteobacteria bacterium]